MIACWILFVCLPFRRKCHLTILSTRLHSRELLVLEFWCLDPLCIAAEGEELITLGAGSSMANALGLLLSVYYVFGFDYPAKASNVYFFLWNVDRHAKKRMAINKFIAALRGGSNCFQHFRRCEFCWVVITTLYQLMQKSCHKETTQSLANMLLWILRHNWLP